jgi:ABC-type nitrate/sulfonate/bicarbonate transport system substrate-binding protein
MVKPNVRMLASSVSHMPLLYTWRDSGVTQKHGFDLSVDMSLGNGGNGFLAMSDRAPKLLDGTYDFLSGLHQDPYEYRARGDKRFVYLAQAQNDWDDSIVANDQISSAADLEGKKFIYTAPAPCVLGNLKHTLSLAGADLSRIQWVSTRELGIGRNMTAIVEAVGRGEAAAAAVDSPFDRRGEEAGLHSLEVPSVPVIHNVTLCANRNWVEANEETTVAFLRSMVDAIHFFKTEPGKTCEILEREFVTLLGLKGPEEVQRLWETWAGLLSAKPYPHPLAVWNVYNLDISHNPAINFINPFELWDTSLLRAIDDSEYIDELYGGTANATNPPVNPVI